jgi:hypothetical protein
MQLLRRYRFLLLIYSAAALVAWHEVRNKFQRAGPTPPAVADVLCDLDPASHMGNFFKGLEAFETYQALLGRGSIGEAHHYAEQARGYFERALASSYNDIEDEQLVYYYALTLIELGAPEAQIERIVNTWRYNFPYTQNPDPREFHETLHESLGRAPTAVFRQTAGYGRPRDER